MRAEPLCVLFSAASLVHTSYQKICRVAEVTAPWVQITRILTFQNKEFGISFFWSLTPKRWMKDGLNVNQGTRTIEKAMAPHSSTLAWKIPWTEEPGRLQSMEKWRLGHDWATSLSLSCIGEGNGNPLQCSCLENPRDSEAWWAAIYVVAQSQTQLKRLSSGSSRTMGESLNYLRERLTVWSAMDWNWGLSTAFPLAQDPKTGKSQRMEKEQSTDMGQR